MYEDGSDRMGRRGGGKGGESASADTVDPVTGHAVCLQVYGFAEDIGVVHGIVFPGALHNFMIVRRTGDDGDERLVILPVEHLFLIRKGLAVILVAEGNFFSFLSGRHLDQSA